MSNSIYDWYEEDKKITGGIIFNVIRLLFWVAMAVYFLLKILHVI